MYKPVLTLFCCNRSTDADNIYLVGKAAAKHKQTAQSSKPKAGASKASANDNVFESVQMDPFVAVSHCHIYFGGS